MLRRRNKYVWSHIPLLRPIIPLLFGLIIGQWGAVDIPLQAIMVVFGSLVLFMFVTNRFPLVQGIFLSLAVFIAGVALGLQDFNSRTHRILDSSSTHFLIEITSVPQPKPKSLKCEVDLLLAFDDGGQKALINKAVAYFSQAYEDHRIRPGDRWLVKAYFKPIRSLNVPYAFNYSKFMRQQGFFYQAYIAEGEATRLNGAPSWHSKLFNIKETLLNRFDRSQWSNQQSSVLKALLLGTKSDLSPEQRQAFAQAGAMHVLAVSGLHVGIIYLLFTSMFAFLLRWRWGGAVRAIILILVLWLFALLTGLSPSVSRAATMFSFIVLGDLTHRKSGVYSAILGSALLLLIIDPRLIYEVGFQLSYVAVLSIVVVQPLIYRWFSFKHKLLDRLWSLTSVSLAAQLATFPLALYYFHQFPLYFLLSNLWVIPLASVLLPVGLTYLVFQPIPILGDVMGWLTGWLSWLMNEGVHWVKALPYASVDGFYLDVFQVVSLYALITLGLVFVKKSAVKWLRYGLMMLLILASWTLVQFVLQFNKSELWFYPVGRELIFAHLSKGNVEWIASDSLESSKYERALVNAHWDAVASEEPTGKVMPDSLPFFSIGPAVVARASQIPSLRGSIETDIVWVDETSIDPSELLQRIRSRIILLSAETDTTEYQAWSHVAQKHGAELHRLSPHEPKRITLSPEIGIE